MDIEQWMTHRKSFEPWKKRKVCRRGLCTAGPVVTRQRDYADRRMMLLWMEAELLPKCSFNRQTRAAVESEKVEGWGHGGADPLKKNN